MAYKILCFLFYLLHIVLCLYKHLTENKGVSIQSIIAGSLCSCQVGERTVTQTPGGSMTTWTQVYVTCRNFSSPQRQLIYELSHCHISIKLHVSVTTQYRHHRAVSLFIHSINYQPHNRLILDGISVMLYFKLELQIGTVLISHN